MKEIDEYIEGQKTFDDSQIEALQESFKNAFSVI